MFRIFLSVLFLSILAAPINAQKTFNGAITYDIQLTGENADQYGALMPNSYEYQFLGSDVRMLIHGGMMEMMMGEFLVKGDKGITYIIKRADGIAYKFEGENTTAQPVITKMDETISIIGYDCIKYKVVSPGTEGSEETVQYIWATKGINIKKPKSSQGGAGTIFIPGLDGFPLKIMGEVQGMTMVYTASKIEAKKLKKSDFTVPKNFKIEPYNPSIFGM